jgi:hypothetical protein
MTIGEAILLNLSETEIISLPVYVINCLLSKLRTQAAKWKSYTATVVEGALGESAARRHAGPGL